MTSRLHHVVCCSHDPERLVGFLTEVVGMPILESFRVPGPTLAASLGWPDSDGADVQVLGEGSCGLVEVVAIPVSLRDRVPAGIAMLSFGTRDLSAAMERAREWGVPVSERNTFATGVTELEVSVGVLEGIAVEFIRFADKTGA